MKPPVTLLANRTDVTERKMFGGLTFMIGRHMCCGVNGNELIVRLDPEREDEALARPHARPMDFTGRPMSGFITVQLVASLHLPHGEAEFMNS
jgi:TfoX/Sxy family transcriptional regulator of competence genes